MKNLFLKAYSIAKELDLNKIADICGIPKKYTWEEPLILGGDLVSTIIETTAEKEQNIFLFYFGSIVFINFTNDEINKIMVFLKNNMNGIEFDTFQKFSDDYVVRVIDKEDDKVDCEYLTNEYITINTIERFVPEIISDVIAKSVALERAEEKMELIMDSLESAIVKIEKAKLMIKSRSIAKIVSKVVRHQYNTISYIMILDKPDVTWSESYASKIYDDLSRLFELKDRYEILSKKTEIVNSIINNLASISNSVRGLFVEWVIVILIVIEVLMAIEEKLF